MRKVFSDGGKKWHRMKNGLPTIQVKDLVIQKANNDLVVGTFGRGIYVIDDYSPLRELTPDALAKPAHLCEPAGATAYVPSGQYGGVPAPAGAETSTSEASNTAASSTLSSRDRGT